MSEKNAYYYIGAITDMKEDIIIKIMKTMRVKGINEIKSDVSSNITYKMVEETRGGKTLGKFIDGVQVSLLRLEPIEEVANLLEEVEIIDLPFD